MWYCCDLQKQITKEHIKIFGAVSARCLKCFGGTEELMVITSRHALPFLKDSNGLLIWLLLHILVYRKVIINILLKKKDIVYCGSFIYCVSINHQACISISSGPERLSRDYKECLGR